MTGKWRIACLAASVFYGLGAMAFQLGYVRGTGHINQFTLIDMVVSVFMLGSVIGMLRCRPWGDVLNALCWAAYFAIFAATQTYFRWLIPVPAPPGAQAATLIGLPISLFFDAAHLRSLSQR